MQIKMFDSYGALEEKNINIKNVLSFHVLKILESLNMYITFKEKFESPAQCFFKAISDYKIEFG